VSVVLGVLRLIVFVFFITLLVRFVIDWIRVFAREWSPRGPALVVAEGVYSATDPPLKFLRRFIPPLRLGGVSIDFAFMVLFFACVILLQVL
jgi:YggT family protein